MVKDLLFKIEEADDALRSPTVPYYNSRIVLNVRDNVARVQVPYDINDILLMGALTNSDVLLSGKTGSAKSHLSRMAMNGLFGENGFTNLTVTPGLNESDFIDVDVEGVKNGEKSLKEAIETTPLLTRPGAIVNEINRTPEILQNIFIGYLERNFSLKGVEFPVGVALIEGRNGAQDPHYQFRVVSINEGQEYSGTSGIDRAVRDRVALEVPMDYFRPRKEDGREMVRKRNEAGLTVDKINGGRLEQILDAVKILESGDVPVAISAEEFLTYLQGLDNCIQSATYSKRGINFNPGKTCAGCKHSKIPESNKGNICGSVYAPSGRSLINLKKLARAVAAVRAYKIIDAVARGDIEGLGSDSDKRRFVGDYLEKFQVTLDDVTAIAPLILANKMDLDQRWVDQEFQGSKYEAMKHLLYVAEQKFKNFVGSSVYGQLIKTDGLITDGIRSSLDTYVRESDPWVYNLADLSSGAYGKTDHAKAKLRDVIK